MRDLRSQVENLDRNLETKREELMRYQVKIQENRLSISNLTDINRSISDMLIRQSELKRSIIELEIENKNLLEMKNNLVDDFRIKNYLWILSSAPTRLNNSCWEIIADPFEK